MTVPTGFAAALGIWFATTTAMLLAEAGWRAASLDPIIQRVASAPATAARDVLRRSSSA